MTTKICENRAFGIVAGLLLGAILLINGGVVYAQSASPAVDNLAPVIELEELARGVADVSQVFTVQIAEETALSVATLYYRRSGEQPYTAADMKPLGVSGFYTVSIPTDPSDLRPIEYYVEAKDAAGNRTVSGFAFDPYQRTLAPSPVAQNNQTAAGDAEEQSGISTNNAGEPFYKKRWVQVTLGVLAVGIIASSMDSGGEDSEVLPVTITLR